MRWFMLALLSLLVGCAEDAEESLCYEGKVCSNWRCRPDGRIEADCDGVVCSSDCAVDCAKLIPGDGVTGRCEVDPQDGSTGCHCMAVTDVTD